VLSIEVENANCENNSIRNVQMVVVYSALIRKIQCEFVRVATWHVVGY